MADLTRVQQAVQGASSVPGVRNLTARQGSSGIEIHGTAENLAAKQNAMRAITDKVGDTGGVVNMIEVSTGASAKMPTAGAAPSASDGVRTHKVGKGETLSHLAQKYYGKASQSNKIFEANRDQLKDPDKIREGMTLKIPG
jgi:nucleoid-associated protein YgaU